MRWVLAQGVENHALLGIFRSYFNDWTAMHPSHHNGIVEEKAARVMRVDAICLEACLRKDDQLRLDRDVESVKHRSQVALWTVKFEVNLTELELAI